MTSAAKRSPEDPAMLRRLDRTNGSHSLRESNYQPIDLVGRFT
jgi:hypothetical protein